MKSTLTMADRLSFFRAMYRNPAEPARSRTAHEGRCPALLFFSRRRSIPLFADDALVLPAGVLRAYVVPAYAWADKQYDNDGKAKDIEIVPGTTDKVSLFNLGFAAEYGVTDWLTAAVQWTPGWYAWSDIKTSPSLGQNFNINGVDDLFAGAKIQIVGEKGLVANKDFRFAVAPGIKIPLPDVDWKQQQKNLAAGDDATVYSLGKHALGLGVRGFFDYVIDEMFFVNFYTEYIYLFERKNVAVSPSLLKQDINYGYELTLELEPHFQYAIADGIRVGAGLPLTYTTTPKVKYDGIAADDTDTTLLSLRPNVSVSFMKTFIPIEAKLQFALPLMGKNSALMNAIDLELRAYLKF
jgi:hypothetical protein